MLCKESWGRQVAVSGYLDIGEELCLASGKHLFWQEDMIYVTS